MRSIIERQEKRVTVFVGTIDSGPGLPPCDRVPLTVDAPHRREDRTGAWIEQREDGTTLSPKPAGAAEVADDFLPLHPDDGKKPRPATAYDPVGTEDGRSARSRTWSNLEVRNGGWLAWGTTRETSRSCRRRKEVHRRGAARGPRTPTSRTTSTSPEGSTPRPARAVPRRGKQGARLKASLDREVSERALLQTLEHLLDHRRTSSWCTRRRPGSRNIVGATMRGPHRRRRGRHPPRARRPSPLLAVPPTVSARSATRALYNSEPACYRFANSQAGGVR